VEKINSPVDVISVCSANGDIRPLRLRMETKDHRLLRIDIDEIVSSKAIQYVGIEAQIFLCRATVEAKEWLFELKYTIRSHSWCLLRRVY
jgi:hypothetical protein